MQILDLNFFLGKFVFFFGDDSSQNIFVYQLTLDILKLKKENGTDYVSSWKSKGGYT